MKVLIIGGSGNISWHCTNRMVERNMDVYVLNRRATLLTRRTLNSSAHIIEADINELERVSNALAEMSFDVVIDFICYNAENAKRDISLFEGKTKQFIFVSSAGPYKRAGMSAPIKEDRELILSNWEYANNKVEAERVFWEAFKTKGFPLTVVRPGHTYDTLLPEAVGNGDFTIANRILMDKPIVVHGDGTTWWTLTNSWDFSNAFIHLVGNKDTIGEAFNIVGDDVMTWRDITYTVAEALGKSNPTIIYIPTQQIEEIDATFASGIKEHKMWNDVYDNTKIKSVAIGWKCQIGYKTGIAETINWLLEDNRRQRINKQLDCLIETLCS